MAPRAALALINNISISSSSSLLKNLDNKILLRPASALACATSLLPISQKKGRQTVLLPPPSSNILLPPALNFHTSVFDRLFGNPKTPTYDLIVSEPREPSEWQYRHVRYGKSQKEWRPIIPRGHPALDHIPEDHVDRAGNPYTTQPLPWNFTEGKHPETGRRTNFAAGQGVRRFYRMVDMTRNVPAGENSPFVERVLEIIDDETRSAFIALVANGDFKRYILASENMKAGDLIKTYNEIPKNPVLALEGDAYPVGALAASTMIHNIEAQPGEGGVFAINAGMYGTIVRKEGDRVIISVFKKKKTYAVVHNREISIDERCMATVGRVSNIQHHLIPIGGVNMKMKLGHRARSGLFQKKDGRFGRKIRPPPDVKIIELKSKPFTPVYKQGS